MVRLALHRSYSPMLQPKSALRPAHRAQITHGEEQPLQLLAVLPRILHRIPAELVLLVELRGEIEQDGGGLEGVEAVVGDGGYAAVGVDLAMYGVDWGGAWGMGTTHSADALSNGTHGEEPGLLDLVVLLADVRVADAHLDDPGTCVEHSSLGADITVLTRIRALRT